jgi:hypothetical protein
VTVLLPSASVTVDSSGLGLEVRMTPTSAKVWRTRESVGSAIAILA